MKEKSPKRLEEHKNDESSASLQVSDNSDRNKNTVKNAQKIAFLSTILKKSQNYLLWITLLCTTI